MRGAVAEDVPPARFSSATSPRSRPQGALADAAADRVAEATVHDAADHDSDGPTGEPDVRRGPDAIARAGESARQARAVVDGRPGPLAADVTSWTW